LTLSAPQALLLLAALGLSSAIPSTPGYVGIYQFVAVTVLVPFGLTQDEALVYIIAFQLVTYVGVTIWGAVGLWRLGVSRRSLLDEAGHRSGEV
ncbi:MAG: flippase-like domain-containing protein, partial [Anaerolineae bacterium]|nr:flippase-like domain-containing protein [Anaerolineae bacterium]